MTSKMTIAGVTFIVGMEQVDTPDGSGQIVDIDNREGRVGVWLYELAEVRWYKFWDVSL